MNSIMSKSSSFQISNSSEDEIDEKTVVPEKKASLNNANNNNLIEILDDDDDKIALDMFIPVKLTSASNSCSSLDS